MVFPAILAVIPVAKVIAVQVATAFGIVAAKKAGEHIGSSRSRRTTNDDDVRSDREATNNRTREAAIKRELELAYRRAKEVEAGAAAAEERANAAEIVAVEQRHLRLLLVRWVFPVATLLAFALGFLVGWLLIPGT